MGEQVLSEGTVQSTVPSSPVVDETSTPQQTASSLLSVTSQEQSLGLITLTGEDLMSITCDGEEFPYRSGDRATNGKKYFRYVTSQGEVFTRGCDDVAFHNAVMNGNLFSLTLRRESEGLSFVSYKTLSAVANFRYKSAIIEKIATANLKIPENFNFA